MNHIVFQNIYNQYRHSVMQGLSQAILEFCDPEFVWTNYLGQSFTRDELLEMLSKGLINYAKWTSENQSVRVFDENCAVLTATDYIIKMRENDPHPVQTRNTIIFHKGAGGWKIIGGQSTDVPITVV
ncbi:hypothetical protein FACS1894217_06070 [Clostridia bacterium]|nr:hypothetical protein FACS1894217_06070 [Clostridia bacterium]